jgi:hypothetical protein
MAMIGAIFWFAAESDPESIEAVVIGMDVVGDEASGRNTSGEEGFLIRLSWWEGRGFEDELDAFGAFRGGDGQPPEGWAHGNVLVSTKPRMVV